MSYVIYFLKNAGSLHHYISYGIANPILADKAAAILSMAAAKVVGAGASQFPELAGV
jgi:hypothetical protein